LIKFHELQEIGENLSFIFCVTDLANIFSPDLMLYIVSSNLSMRCRTPRIIMLLLMTKLTYPNNTWHCIYLNPLICKKNPNWAKLLNNKVGLLEFACSCYTFFLVSWSTCTLPYYSLGCVCYQVQAGKQAGRQILNCHRFQTLPACWTN